ncbi:MAG: ATP-binding cassette domain-containing protein [Faecalibacterium sp.]
MLIHLEKLGKTFGEKVVLHDVTASVEREDRIGIVGQNGAGKTTLLKILTGEYHGLRGRVQRDPRGNTGHIWSRTQSWTPRWISTARCVATFAPVLDAMAQMQILERAHGCPAR